MKEQMSVAELIQTVSQSMKGDGIKQDYITQLSYTWKALEQYLIAQDLVFSKENAFAFLKDKYDIHADQNFAKLRPIDKINEGNEQSVLCSIVLMEKVYIVKKHIGLVLSTMLMYFPSMNS